MAKQVTSSGSLEVKTLTIFTLFCGIVTLPLGTLAAEPATSAKWSDERRTTANATEPAEMGAGDSFSMAVWTKISGETDAFPAIASNKPWENGAVVDLISEHNMGVTLDTGGGKGWTLAVQPNGSWLWNIGNGRSRLDYLPTKQRQPINDDRWHLLAFTIDRSTKTARLFYDGKNVAIYSIRGFGDLASSQQTVVGGDQLAPQPPSTGVKGTIELASCTSGVLTDEAIFELYRQRYPEAKREPLAKQVGEIKVLSWNIWHGARHPGKVKGVQQAIDFIKETGADVIAMQETYGSGPTIADALGYHFYLRSSNLSVMSRYPIVDTHDLYDPFRLGGVTLQLSESQQANVFSLWIHYLPAWRRDAMAAGATEKGLIEGEWKTRASELQDILRGLEPFVAKADEVPLIVAGDFNSPSKLDWTPETKDWHNGLAVDWPVSRQMLDAGFIDTYRKLHPDPSQHKPHELWNGDARRIAGRIDYIYTLGAGVEPTASRMMNTHGGVWPSDHPAVLTTMRLGKQGFGVVTYNILEGFSNSASERFPAGSQRKEAVAQWLADQAPAIVGFQELNGYSQERLQTEAGAWGHPHAATLKDSGYIVGLTSRYPINVVERHLQGMHHGLLHCQTAGIDCFVVHLSPFKYQHRQKEAAEIVDRVKRVMAAGRPVVVMGDFNAVSEADRARYDGDAQLLQRLQASDRRHAHVTNLNEGKLDYSTMRAFADAGLVDLYAKHRSQNKSANTRRIDYILVSPDLAAGSKQSAWHVTERHRRMSDHYPVSAELSWHPKQDNR